MPKTTKSSTSKTTASKASAAKTKSSKTTKTSSKTAKKAVEQDKLHIEEDSESGGSSGRSLVIVESPAKAKTIKKILGNKYQIMASVGHIRDLPQKKLGVDVEHNFEPAYEVMPEKTNIVEDLRTAAKKSEAVYLAADPDREGEAIAWHISALLEGVNKNIHRVEFHEITKNGVQEAMKHPRPIDEARVNAQQARRVLDRLVGYKLSPLLWKKVTKGLSAGRVQSVAVRLICERDAEIQAFVPVEYWSLQCELAPSVELSKVFVTDLSKVDGKKPEIPNEAAMNAIIDRLKKAPSLKVLNIAKRESKRNPTAPFITSSLQREASNRYGYQVKRTMQIAQKLYEGMDLGSEGPVGLITYMRTDSTRISEDAQLEAKEFIHKIYGAEYYPETPRDYTGKKKKNVQDAHEAIRPTSVYRTPESLRSVLNEEQYKIYKLVWDRFVSSQMASAKIETDSIEIGADNVVLRISNSKVIFPGYLKVYRAEDEDDPEAEQNKMPNLKEGDDVKLIKPLPKQHFTEPPPRFNEASLVKTMEELGIGRPSTYAPTITTIQDRNYVRKEDNALVPTELGKSVNMLLVQHFQDVVDVHFTANLENRLDEIAENHIQWQGVVRDFYEPFETTLKKASQEMEKVNVIIDNEMCPDCGKPMALKTSRWGSQFLGCTGYPECKSTKPLSKDMKPVPDDKPTDEKCTECQGPMVIRYGRYGEYLACITETCKAKRPLVINTGVKCPQCGTGDIVQRKSFRGKIFFGCNQYPKCNFAVWNKPTGAKCPDCESLLVEKVLKKGTFHACSSKECKYSEQVEAPAK